MGTVLDEIQINIQIDDRYLDWAGSGNNQNDGGFGFLKIYGNGTEDRGFSNREIMNNLVVDVNDLAFMNNAGGAGKIKPNMLSKFLKGLQDAMSSISSGNTLGDAFNSLFGKEKRIDYPIKSFHVPMYISPWRLSIPPFKVMPIVRDTFVTQEQINTTNWTEISTSDSLRAANKVKVLNIKYELE